MDMCELLNLLHHEAQKTYDFVHAVTRPEGGKDASTLHIAMESIEIEVPVTMTARDAVFDPTAVKGLPRTAQALRIPYLASGKTHQGVSIPRKRVEGKSLVLEVVGPIEKLDDRVAKESIGRIKVVLKPVLK